MKKSLRVERAGTFAAFLAAAKAIELRRPDDLVVALQATPREELLHLAARHRCLGYLRRGILELGIRSGPAGELAAILRAYASRAALQAYAVRGQLEQLMRALNEASVSFALLKGSARLFRGDREADFNTMYDLDVLVPRDEAIVATYELQRGGYHPQFGGRRSARYWTHHHHLVPLQPAEIGLPVELHVQLAPPGCLSIASDWDACRPYFERVANHGVEATCFNTLGTAVHLTIHGSGIRRLHDVILLSRILRAEPGMYDQVLAAVSQERWQSVALQAVVALGAHIGGCKVSVPGPVQRYLSWVSCREDLAPYVRDRSQFADAWYCNGGKVWGPATRQALRSEGPTDQNAVVSAALFAYHIIGRVITSAYAVSSAAKAPTNIL